MDQAIDLFCNAHVDEVVPLEFTGKMECLLISCVEVLVIVALALGADCIV